MAFCAECGAKLPDGAAFCGECGAPNAPAAAPEPRDAGFAPASGELNLNKDSDFGSGQSAEPTGVTVEAPPLRPEPVSFGEPFAEPDSPAAPKKPRRKLVAAIITAAAAVAVIAVGIFVLLPMLRGGAEKKIVANAQKEFTDRLGSTPAAAIAELVQTLRKGSLQVTVDYESDYSYSSVDTTYSSDNYFYDYYTYDYYDTYKSYDDTVNRYDYEYYAGRYYYYDYTVDDYYYVEYVNRSEEYAYYSNSSDRTVVDAELKADFDNRSYQLTGSLKQSRDWSSNYNNVPDSESESTNVSFDGIVSPERVALSLPDFSDKYYGIDFGTFGNDFDKFLANNDLEDELSADERAAVVDGVLLISDLINIDYAGLSEKQSKKIDDYVGKFLKGISKESRETVEIGGTDTKATKKTYTFDADTIVEFVKGYFDAAKDSEIQSAAMQPVFDYLDKYSDLFGDYADIDIDEFMSVYEDALEDAGENIADALEEALEDMDFEGASVALYIVKERIARIDVSAEIGGEEITAYLDLGLSADEDWVFEATDEDGNGIRAVWSRKVSGDKYTNEITIVPLYDGKKDTSGKIVLGCAWNQKTGDFTLSFNDGYDTYSQDGNLKIGEDTFALTLSFEDGYDSADYYYGDGTSSVWSNRVTVTITGKRGEVKIPNPDVVTIDKWDESLYNELEEWGEEIGANGFLGF
ncbi:MAG: zinc ribbon domain-containing protein [Oscillospiraceae bacterium]|jgi:hypothetical protein|nr:zinc ribbon domain-containing protein [Oscillospiraceae bacterium]